MSKGTGKAGGLTATRSGGRTAVRKASGVRYVKSDRALRAGDVAVRVSVDKLDKAWDKGQRIGDGRYDQGKQKYDTARKYMESGKKVNMPQITIGKGGRVVFTDGRHRAAAARDMGKKYIYVTVPRSQAKKAKKELG